MGKVRKTILVAEIVALLAGGGILAFAPEGGAGISVKKPSREKSAAVSEISSAPVTLLTDEERAALKESLKIDINTASKEILDRLPSVGPSTAERIIAYREQLGGFTSIDQLNDVPGIGDKTFNEIKKHVRIGEAVYRDEAPSSELVDLNSAGRDELAGLPGIGEATADQIIASRPFSSVEDLDRVPGIGSATLDKLRPHIKVSGNAAREAQKVAAVTTTEASASGRININTASAADLENLPGIGPAAAKNIVEFRKKNGPFRSVDDLDAVPKIGPSTIDKLRSKATVK